MKQLLAFILLTFSVQAIAMFPISFYDPESIVDTATRTGLKYPGVADIYFRQIIVTYNETDSSIKLERSAYEFQKVGGVIEPIDGPVYIPSSDPKLITLENLPTNGEWIEVSSDPTFASFQTGVFHQYINEDLLNGEYPQVVTIVASDAEAKYEYWLYGRTIEQVIIEPEPVDPEFTQDQLLGVMTRYQNQLGPDIGKAIRSHGNNYDDRELILPMVDHIRELIKKEYP